MSAPEMFLVTVRCSGEKTELDMELPAGLPMNELGVKVLNVLKGLYPEHFDSWAECRLAHGHRTLKNEETLARAGVFDGQYLDVIKP